MTDALKRMEEALIRISSRNPWPEIYELTRLLSDLKAEQSIPMRHGVEYVKHEDYAKLEGELRRLKAEREADKERLAFVLAEGIPYRHARSGCIPVVYEYYYDAAFNLVPHASALEAIDAAIAQQKGEK